MEFAGITADQFTAADKAYSSDEAVAKWFTQTAKAHPPAESETWNQMMLNRGQSRTQDGSHSPPIAPPHV
jgi:Domain of unknown function (DUF5069)